jgi:hypothetical protein
MPRQMRVNWRVVLAVMGGLVLPIPLVLALTSGLFPRPSVETIGGRTVSPVLSAEERLRLQTYHRECSRAADCDPPLGCVSDTRYGGFYCSDSQCATDAQCPDGFACRPLPTWEGGPLVRYCIPPGIQQEGSSCLAVPSEPNQACAPGLLCGDGWCGRPCQLGTPSICPDGFFCADTIPGPACRPTCDGRACPEGLQCIHGRGGASACAVVYGQNCEQTPCAQGQRCVAVFAPGKEDPRQHVWMECFPQCDKGLPPCPDGFACEGRTCLKPCDPNGPNVCEPGYSCQRRYLQQPWLCQSDM